MLNKINQLLFIAFCSIFTTHTSQDLEGIDNKYLSCTQLPPDVHDIIEEYAFDPDHAKAFIKDAKYNELKQYVEFLRKLNSTQKSELQFYSRLEFLNIELCPDILKTLTKISKNTSFRLSAFLVFISYNGMHFTKKLWAPIACPVNLYLNNQYCTSSNTYTEEFLRNQENLINVLNIIFPLIFGFTINKYLDLKSIGNFLRNSPKNLKDYFSRKKIFNFFSNS